MILETNECLEVSKNQGHNFNYNYNYNHNYKITFLIIIIIIIIIIKLHINGTSTICFPKSISHWYCFIT